jgi:hypothetical protein
MKEIKIELDDDRYRRWVIAAGRSNTPAVEEWVSSLIDRVIAAEAPGRRNPVLHELDPPPLPEVRSCQLCGSPLAADTTLRRTYCSDLCRVRAWRRKRRPSRRSASRRG